MKLLMITVFTFLGWNSFADEENDYRRLTHTTKAKVVVLKSYYQKVGDDYELKREKICEDIVDVPVFGDASDSDKAMYNSELNGLTCEFESEGKSLYSSAVVGIGRDMVPTIDSNIPDNLDISEDNSKLGWVSYTSLSIYKKNSFEATQEPKYSFEMSAGEFPSSKLLYVSPSETCEIDENNNRVCPAAPYYEAIAIIDGNFKAVQK